MDPLSAFRAWHGSTTNFDHELANFLTDEFPGGDGRACLGTALDPTSRARWSRLRWRIAGRGAVRSANGRAGGTF